MKKILVCLVGLLVFACSLTIQAQTITTINGLRAVWRTDETIPFLRIVVETDHPVTPKLVIRNKDKVLLLTLSNTKIGKLERALVDDNPTVRQVTVTQKAATTMIAFQLQRNVAKEEVQFFSLPAGKGAASKVRLVLDIKNPVAPILPSKESTIWSKTENIGSAPETTALETVRPYHSVVDTKVLRGKIICIDPGHGGSDGGAIGRKVKEKDLTLQIAKRLAARLTQAGARVVLTRDRDTDVFSAYAGAVEELQARCNIANTAKADVFLSIHLNSSIKQAVGGIETFYNSKTPYDYSLANYVHQENAKATTFVNRGLHGANFYLLLHSNMPAVLVELGFISNPREEATLMQEEQQEQFAKSMMTGLSKYFAHKGT